MAAPALTGTHLLLSCPSQLVFLNRLTPTTWIHPGVYKVTLENPFAHHIAFIMVQHVTTEGTSDAVPTPDLASLMLTAMSLGKLY